MNLTFCLHKLHLHNLYHHTFPSSSPTQPTYHILCSNSIPICKLHILRNMRLKSIYTLFDTKGENSRKKRKRDDINTVARPAETLDNGHNEVLNILHGLDSMMDELTIMVTKGQEEVGAKIKGLESMIVELTTNVIKGQEEVGAQAKAATVTNMDVVMDKLIKMVDVVETKLSMMVTCLEGIERKLYAILKRTIGLA